MISKNLTTTDLEKIYDTIAEGIDKAGPDKAVLFLSKLALALSNHIGSSAVVIPAIDVALKDL